MNLDHGAGRIRGVFTGGNNAPLAQVLEACTAPLKDIGVASVLDQSTWPADQWVYSSIGLPTLAFLQDPLDYDTRAHHTNLDTPEHLSAEDMAQASTVAAVLLAQMAAMDEAPPRPKP